MKKCRARFFTIIIIAILGTIAFVSCSISQKVMNKSGTQLWGENCGRCHNAPGPGEFNAVNWDLIGTHMRLRTNITEKEEMKIIEYLKGTAN